MHPDRERQIRSLFDEYIEMYAARDDRLTMRFSENFSGYTGGGNVLVKARDEWVKITRQDFAQVPGRIRIEMLDISLQDVSDRVVAVTAFFHIHLPVPDHILSREVARLVLIFRLEGDDWKIVHSGISIPYHLVQEGEVYPLKSLQERNSALEALVAARTQALHESQALYRLLTEDTLDVLWKTDRNLCLTYISPSDERLRGYKAEEVVGHHVFDLFTDEGVAAVKKLMRDSQASGEPASQAGFLTFQVQHRCKDGRLLWGEVLSKPERNAEGAIVGYHGITREITERRRLEDQVRQLAFHDPLTNLPNRRLLRDRLGHAMAASKRSACHGALMFLDLDEFKTLNDTHGHEAGDLLLLEVAGRLKGCVREVDTVSRFGGDEFVVLLAELNTDRAESHLHAQLIAEKIRAALAEPYVLVLHKEGKAECTIQYRCSASIGAVIFANHAASQDDVMKWADAAMYRAKDAGRNTIRFYQAES
ncbi:diguanylate cyclase domain-containing protein [Sulfuritalea sp.]|uniref:diguanylate cyclase domain-containing protein n=1 Tax=Sulfuritalea sp. TaxID=2480090 RepID=UPI00286DE2CE|nr:diguanylate cyclase [Sulfuritalea sp.]